MKYALEKIKLNIVKSINQAVGKKIVKASDLITPPNPQFGDLNLPCFELAKKIHPPAGGKTAAEMASFLVSKIEAKSIIAGIKPIGPYLNFTINKKYLTKNVIDEVLREKYKYGKNNSGKSKRVMIEYSNANTHKEYHVGHLRNICYGDSVNKILSANGFKSIPVSYINDFGIHVAKTLWCYLEFYKNKELPKNKGRFLGEIYSRSTKEIEKNKLAKEKVSFLMKKIESKKGVEYKLWEKTRIWSIEQFNKIYKELNIKFDHTFYESEFINKGLREVEKLYKKKFLEKSDGAIIANLEKYDLGVLLFLRSDGTALYPVADLPLAIEKIKKYKLDKSIYVVDVRQGLYFKQLFKVLELLGYKQGMEHLVYEFVKLPGGMMSSRSGNVIPYEDLRETAMSKAVRETKERHKDWSAKKVEEVANKIVNGAIKFEMIKVGANQIINFDIDKALRFDGFTATYLQYVCARINSIIKKYNANSQINTNTNYANLVDEKENGLIMKLAKYPEVIKKAGSNYDPSEIARYLFELAQEFNDYYHNVPVLKADKEKRDGRIILISSISQIIKNGLTLLGISVVDEM
ncbi:MAG: arginine--tRNA ligase [Candidatus Falkowbacteria bacterium]